LRKCSNANPIFRTLSRVVRTIRWGGRALYLGSSIYRIHGSNEPWTIGKNVSSGCIRMRNADVIDLYERVKVGTKVVVM
jgi:lipoprotein-anchoring transpeptidase ErfK/SrfK